MSHLQNELTNQFQPLVGKVDLRDSDVFERNLLTVEVFFKDFNYEEILEVPSYNVSISMVGRHNFYSSEKVNDTLILMFAKCQLLTLLWQISTIKWQLSCIFVLYFLKIINRYQDIIKFWHTLYIMYLGWSVHFWHRWSPWSLGRYVCHHSLWVLSIGSGLYSTDCSKLLQEQAFNNPRGQQG